MPRLFTVCFFCRVVFIALSGCLATQARLTAEVRLPALFSDHAVLQRAAKVPVWGWAVPGEDVSVSFAGETAKTKAGTDGKWRTTLDLSDVGAGPFDLIVKGGNELKVTDILVGEVWLCLGQSNMEMKLSTTLGAKEVMATTNNSQLRHFKVETNASATPVEDVAGKWVLAVYRDAGLFTGVGFYFGQSLQQNLSKPVGLVNLSWGGSLAEAWMSPEALAGDEEIRQRTEALKSQIDLSERALLPRKIPSRLYNGMLSPVIPYGIAGAIWYQGESNVGSGLGPLYAKLLSAMIRDWRGRWAQNDFPLYVCQLANFQPKQSEPGATSLWAELREGQTRFTDTANTGQAILIDLGEDATVHPRNKKDVGERLARLALARDYGRDVVYSGPVFKSFAVEGGKIRLSFTHAGGGLVARELPAAYAPSSLDPAKTVPLVRNSPGSQLEGFVICGESRRWVWAEARIEGDTVVVSSPQVPAPVAVRYAWSNNPTCNLYNDAGLPAGPFRTDEFPGSVKK